MNLYHLDLFMKIVVLLLAFAVHESAHAWTASHYGDPTARLLGRVSLNPIRHIDLFGSIILPAVMLIAKGPVFGWAKPTPVDPLNFKEPVKADIMTSVAGPVSNFALVAIGFVLTAAILALAPNAQANFLLAVEQMDRSESVASPQELSILFPTMLFLVELMFINVLLGIFNLLPIPPLDGSHVARHFLPESVQKIYDSVGMIALVVFVIWGGDLLWRLIDPVLGILFRALMRIHG